LNKEDNTKMFDIVKRKELVRHAHEKGFEDFFIVNEDILLISESDTKKLRKEILDARKKGQIVVVLGNNDLVNRFAIESKVDILLSPEFARKKDFPDYRNSGLNQVLCREAAENNVAIGINLSDILHLEGIEKSLRLGRIMQNVRLCIKFHVPVILATFAEIEAELRNSDELISFGISLGMSRKEAEDALIEIKRKIKKRDTYESKSYPKI